MKKFLTLLLTVVIAVASLSVAACGGNDQDEVFKVGFIFLHDEQSTYDLNFINAAKAACEAFNLKDNQIIMKKGVPETSECYDAAEELVNKGCKVIFADSFSHEGFLIQSANEHPEVQYFHATGTSSNVTEGSRIVKNNNVHNAFANIYEGRYLAGYTAGLKLAEMIENKDAKVPASGDINIGYVGAFTYAEVISGYTAWYLGVKQGCIDGGKEADAARIKMKVTFTGSWYDVSKEKAGAELLISKGCVIISQHADSMGAPSACEDAGVLNVFYNGTTINECPKTFLIASRIDWTFYMKLMIGSVMEGKTVAKDYCATIEDGAVVLAEANKALVSDEQMAKVNEMREKLVNKTARVFDCSKFTVAKDTKNATVDENGKLLTYSADYIDVKGDDGKSTYVPDGNVVKTDEKTNITYFSESSERSAPYFDLKIEGIELLDTKF